MNDFKITLDMNDFVKDKSPFRIDEEVEFEVIDIDLKEIDASFDAHNELGFLKTYKRTTLRVASFKVYLLKWDFTKYLTDKAYAKIEEEILERNN